MKKRTSVERDTATMSLKHVAFGGGVFDNTGEHPNKKGWDIFELGQKSFWAVPTAVDWSVPVREDPEYADAIAAMLAFLAPGEKAAVHGASMISTKVESEEAKFYFVEQALEEAKHFDALRRLYGKISGKPLGEPSASIRMLYSFGVVDPDDVAFMMGSINIIGEHLANQIFHQINHVAKDDTVRKVLALIGKDESRHIAAGQRFFPEVYSQFRKNRHRIFAKNLATTLILLAAGYELVNPMKKLDIDLAKILEAMYQHYEVGHRRSPGVSGARHLRRAPRDGPQGDAEHDRGGSQADGRRRQARRLHPGARPGRDHRDRAHRHERDRTR